MPGIGSPFDVERIRVRAERAAREALQFEEPESRLQYIPEDSATRRRELMAQSLLLTDSMAPTACAAGRDALAALGVDDRLELFKCKGPDTARLVLYGNPIGVEFMGRYLEIHDRPAITAIVGHEVGHALAHCGDPMFAWALSASQSPNTPARRTYSLAAEMTADRFGLLACRDLEAVLRLEMLCVTGPGGGGIQLDTKAYLKQCRSFADELLSNGGGIVGSSHPDHYLRTYAEWLFSETDLYAELTGAGSGARTIADVDALIDRLLIRHEDPYGENRRAPSEVLGKGFSAIGEIAIGMVELTHASMTETVARATRSVSSTLETLAGAVIGSTSRAEETSHEEPAPDLLEQEERDLEAQFAELERREREKR